MVNTDSTPEFVFDGENRKWIEGALKAGLPIGHIEYILVLAQLHDKSPKDIQDGWMNAHVGVQQIFRAL
jgi:hypothetical protein